MPPRVAAAAVLLLASLCAHAQGTDPNLQNLLNALTTGSEVTLVTPLANGMLQVTSFNPGARLSAAEAAGAMSRARSQLQALGEPEPSAEEIARMLAGGPIRLPSGLIQAVGILPSSGHAALIQSQVVLAGTPLPPGAYTGSAAAGGTTPPAPRELALQQLAAIGIINPTEDQIRTALLGGPIQTRNGVYELPGVVNRYQESRP